MSASKALSACRKLAGQWTFKTLCAQSPCISKTTLPVTTLPVTMLPVRSHHDGQTTGGAAPPDNTFYEMRTYKIKPADFPAFLKLTNEKMNLRLAHSKLIGYWVTDIGGLNEVFHIWEYDCFAHRAAVRAGLAKDETWNAEYFSKALQMFASQENAAAKLLPWKPLQSEPIKEGGTYELRQYVLNPGSVNELESRIMIRDEFCINAGCGKLMGAWMGDIGDVNLFYALWNFENADKRMEARSGVLQSAALKNLSPCTSLTPDMRSKIMTPLPFSPLK